MESKPTQSTEIGTPILPKWKEKKFYLVHCETLMGKAVNKPYSAHCNSRVMTLAEANRNIRKAFYAIEVTKEQYIEAKKLLK